MHELNLPSFSIKTKQSSAGLQVFDVVRRKYVQLTPEEWVRQHLINYMIHHLAYPKNLLAVEKRITFNGLTKRYDIAVYNKYFPPVLLVECKAPHIAISQDAFDQIAR